MVGTAIRVDTRDSFEIPAIDWIHLRYPEQSSGGDVLEFDIGRARYQDVRIGAADAFRCWPFGPAASEKMRTKRNSIGLPPRTRKRRYVRDIVEKALLELFGSDFRDHTTLPDRDLIAKVESWFAEKGSFKPSTDTILRAAGRKK